MEKTTIPHYAGHQYEITLVKRDDGTCYVSFTTKEGCGSPSLELEELEYLVARLKRLKEER